MEQLAHPVDWLALRDSGKYIQEWDDEISRLIYLRVYGEFSA